MDNDVAMMVDDKATSPPCSCLNARSEGIMLPQAVPDCGGKRVDWTEQDLATQGSLRTVCKQFEATLPSAFLKPYQHSADWQHRPLVVPPQKQVIAMQNHQNHAECADFSGSVHSQTVKATTSEDPGEQLPHASLEIHEPHPRTTVMIGHIPFAYSCEQLVEELHALGFHRKTFDLLHLSEGKKATLNRGFAFVNFIQESTALQCFDRVTGHVWNRHQSTNVRTAAVRWAAIQGYAENLKARKRDVAIQHNLVLDADATSSHASRVLSAPTQQGLGLQVYQV